MIESASPRPHSPGRRVSATPARIAVPLVAGLVLTGCGPSPVDMVEHPITTTPSRMAGEELQRSAEPDESCAPEPAPAESGDAGERAISDAGPDEEDVSVPNSPRRILALGPAAVDVACALGLQEFVVGTAGLPGDADAFLPESLVGLPEVLLPSGPDHIDPEAVAASARDLEPDLILLPGSPDRDPAVARALTDIAPTVLYQSDVVRWTGATEQISDAYGRPRAGGDLLLDVIAHAEATYARTTPSDTRVSLLSVTGGEGDGVAVQAPDTLGSLMLEAVDAGRPPAQRTRDGESIPPAPESPQVADELDGDMIFAVVGGRDDSEERAREVFASDRWTELDAVRSRRMFVVDRAVWEGAGPVAARAVLEDIAESINGIAPDG